MLIGVVIPVFNDWLSCTEVVRKLDLLCAAALAPSDSIHVLVVDDDSVESPDESFHDLDLRKISRVDILRLRMNLGHQRAIACGICHFSARESVDAILVMDGDGEDRPEDAIRLIQAFQAERELKTIFAGRIKRSEGPVFKAGYWLYRQAHLLLTGIPVRVGNFSVLPLAHARKLSLSPHLWNHYAAAVLALRLRHSVINTNRGYRYYGKSTMNLVSLITHGFSALSVFADRIGVRALMMILTLSTGLVGLIAAVATIRIASDWAIPGWASLTIGVLAIILLQLANTAALLSFFVLSSRGNSFCIPARDYAIYCEEVTEMLKRDDAIYLRR